MTQHIYTANAADGQKVDILIGWDRSLRGFFMEVEAAGAGDDDGYLYSNLENKDSFPQVLAPYLDWLKAQGIGVPEGLVSQLKLDQRLNAGNEHTVWALAEDASAQDQPAP